MNRSIALAICASMVCAVPATHAAEDLCRHRSAEILQNMQKGDYVAATTYFDSHIHAALDAQKLGQVWQQVLPQQLGAFDHAMTVQVKQSGELFIAETPLHFANGWLVMRVTCGMDGQVGGLLFAPSQVPAMAAAATLTNASGVTERVLAVSSPFGPLPGTLTLPSGDGPFAAVLLIAGSGPHDRDETIGPNKPLRDLAQGLAIAGIASLRYDKRTYVYAAQSLGKAITVDDEVTDDALSALRLLAEQAAIDPHRLFVLGHSLGALMAPRIGQRDPRIAGLILLGAPARFNLDTVLRQIRYIGQQEGASTAVLDKQTAPVIAARDAMAHADPAHPPAGQFFHAPASYWLSLRDYDAVDVSKALSVPILVLQGGGDYQVTPQYDFVQWQAAFPHDSRVQLREYAGLSHLFMPAGTPPLPADYEQPGQVDARVIRDIAGWIKAQPGHL